MCTMVVFPAPLGPSSAKMVPSATVRSMSSSTTLSPNDFRSPVTETAALVAVIVVISPPSGTADHDVAVAGAGTHLDGLAGWAGTVRGVHLVADMAELRVDVEPGGGAGVDADLDLAEAGLERGRAAHDLADPDVAVGGAGGDVGARLADGDVAVGRVHPQVAGDLANPAVAVGVLDHRRSVDVAQAYPAGPRTDLGPARGPVHGNGAGAGVHLERAGLLELDVAGRGLDPALAEAAGTADRYDRGVAVHIRA